MRYFHVTSVWAGRLAMIAVAVGLCVGLAACGGVDHQQLDEWKRTEHGPEKLADALANEDLSADLRAHAAANLVAIDKLDEVMDALKNVPESARGPLMAPLVDRLWDEAQIKARLDRPTMLQVRAKDGLFSLRALAPEKVRATIDGHLVDWLAGFFEGRSEAGRFGGEVIIRAIGPSAGEKLVAAADEIIAAPEENGRRRRLGDELLRGLAYSGSPSAVALLLKLTSVKDRDPALGERAMAALYQAYVEPVGTEPADPAALAKNLDALVAVSRRSDVAGQVVNDAVTLIATSGMPGCLEPLVAMVSYLHRDPAYRWMGVQQGIRCGKGAAIVPILEALPETEGYSRGLLDKYAWDEVIAAAPAPAVVASAKKLVTSKSAVARISGAELLVKVAQKTGKRGEVDAAVAKLAGDKAVLRGWHGKGPGADPTVGEVATKLKSELQEVEKTPGKER